MVPLTIVIPSYNRAALLAKTLQSLVGQSHHNFTVILVDHSSTDNTKEIFEQYKHEIDIHYYEVSRSEEEAPPRSFGMRKVMTPIVVFLDSGIVVPSHYVQAHLAFHQERMHMVGVGMCHGDHPGNPDDHQWDELFTYTHIDQVAELLRQKSQLCDERSHIDFSQMSLSWLYGWSGNISMLTEDYWAAGGFASDIGFGLEDLDLSYRLYKHGCSFARVEDGWGLHLPHPYPPSSERRARDLRGWQYSYRQHRSLALEVAGYTDLIPSKAEKAFRYLSQAGREYARLPLLADDAHAQIARPALLVGATVRDAQRYDYLTLADENVVSTSSIWSCSGILIPRDDATLATVVVSDMWKWLGVSFQIHKVSLLERLISEIKRSAQKAVFLHSPWFSSDSEHESVSLETLTTLCHRYDLPFEITSDTEPAGAIPS
jgi:glycosyltransferase involved in cell wall biosynthesis